MSKLEIPMSWYPEVTASVEKAVADWEENNPNFKSLLDEAAEANFKQWGIPYFRAGVVALRKPDEKILMMREGRIKVKDIIKKIGSPDYENYCLVEKGFKKGDWVDGDYGWNLPSGRLKLGENFEDAAVREVKEETGWDIKIKGCLCCRVSKDPKNPYVMPIYLADAISGPEEFSTPETRETTAIGFFSFEGVSALMDANVLRSPGFVKEALDSFQ